MAARGWTILRFWSWDVVMNREAVLESIGEALRNHPPRPT
jgi:very-short-patch-repair endonuclease